MIQHNVVPITSAVQDSCIICNAPLGQESKDEKYIVCHEHRKCAECGTDVRPQEAQLCYNQALEGNPERTDFSSLYIAHTRCTILSMKTADQDATLSIKQSYLDYLNLIRLMVEPDLELSVQTNENNAMIQCSKLVQNMQWDQKYTFLKRLEAACAQASILVRQDPKVNKKALDEREKVRAKQAKQQAETSSRPIAKKADDSIEIEIGQFMKEHDIIDRKYAMKMKKQLDKSVEDLVVMAGKQDDEGFEEKMRADLISSMVKSGALKK